MNRHNFEARESLEEGDGKRNDQAEAVAELCDNYCQSLADGALHRQLG